MLINSIPYDAHCGGQQELSMPWPSTPCALAITVFCAFNEYVPCGDGRVRLLQAAVIYKKIDEGVGPHEMQLDEQLVFFNDLFGWAGVAFYALAGRSAAEMMYGPSPEGRAFLLRG